MNATVVVAAAVLVAQPDDSMNFDETFNEEKAAVGEKSLANEELYACAKEKCTFFLFATLINWKNK